jgi:uncharacterized oligopeptide transporter (OPT) family protein
VAIPVLYWIGFLQPPLTRDLLSLILWTLAAAYYGLFFAVPLRDMTILRQKLPFPTGTATAHVIRALHDGAKARERAKEEEEEERERTDNNESRTAPMMLDGEEEEGTTLDRLATTTTTSSTTTTASSSSENIFRNQFIVKAETLKRLEERVRRRKRPASLLCSVLFSSVRWSGQF